MNRSLICKNLSLKGSDATAKRAQILDYFLKTYEIYERLFDILRDDTVFYKQPEPLRHPLIFYFGHTAAFYINKLVLAGKLSRINEKFESIFAIGVDEMSWDDLDSKRYSWPSVEETRSYREDVKMAVVDFINNAPLELPIRWNSDFWIIMMGIEHERIHLETSSVLIRQLDISLVKNSIYFPRCQKSDNEPENELLKVQGGCVVLGKNRDDDYYGWDNEYGSFETVIEDFFASKYLVSNGEYLEFVVSGGYLDDSNWSAEGLSWREFKNAKHPTFWILDNDKFRYRCISEIIDMPLDWPVDVNFHEAKAYCNWLSSKTCKQIRLLTESEWRRLFEFCIAKDGQWQEEAVNANINLEYFASACPVNQYAYGSFYDVIGNVWQWCETPIYGFDGFEVHPIYDDFSVPTFDDRHNIIKGGSFISTGNETLATSRYAFRRHFYQHAGFRYVVSPNQIEDTNAAYEKDEVIVRDLKVHYGETTNQNNLRVQIASFSSGLNVPRQKKKALELGCSVGMGSFELAKFFDEVVGIDFSARFIRCAEHLKKDGIFKYATKNSDNDFEYHKIEMDKFGISEQVRSRVKFWQGDACNLKPVFSGFNMILASCILEKIYNPRLFLQTIHERLEADGVLVIASIYEFDEEYTKKEFWLGDTKFDAMLSTKKILQANFIELKNSETVKFDFIETSGAIKKYIYELSAWQKK